MRAHADSLTTREHMRAHERRARRPRNPHAYGFALTLTWPLSSPWRAPQGTPNTRDLGGASRPMLYIVYAREGFSDKQNFPLDRPLFYD